MVTEYAPVKTACWAMRAEGSITRIGGFVEDAEEEEEGWARDCRLWAVEWRFVGEGWEGGTFGVWGFDIVLRIREERYGRGEEVNLFWKLCG